MKLCGIYCLTNKLTGKKYVGQSRDIAARWVQHSKGKESFSIGRSIAKHGWQAFSAEVLELCDPQAMNERERHWIDAIGCLSPRGYNLTTGGCQGKEVPDDVRRVISERTRAGLTPEVLERRRLTMIGIPKSQEWRAAMSERQRNPANVARMLELSRNQSESTRAKIAAAATGRKASQETRSKLSAAAKADGRAERMRLSPSYMSDATRAKMSAAAKARCERARLSNAPAP